MSLHRLHLLRLRKWSFGSHSAVCLWMTLTGHLVHAAAGQVAILDVDENKDEEGFKMALLYSPCVCVAVHFVPTNPFSLQLGP
jgi:hypothetical protein